MTKPAIQTNVDALVEIVNEAGRISFKDAAKKLAMPISNLEELAYVLEEEHVFDIDYKLNIPFLVRRQLSEGEKKEKLKHFERERELFHKKLDAAGSFFHELDKKIESVNKMFSDMGDNLDDKLQQVNQDITNLIQAEARKQQLDTQVIEAKRKSIEKFNEVEAHIRELKVSYEAEYTDSKKSLTDDQAKLSTSQKFLDKVKLQEQLLEQKLAEVRKISQSIQDEAVERSKTLTETQKHMSDLRAKHVKLEAELEAEHAHLLKTIAENEKQEAQIRMSQKSIFDKIEAEERALDVKEREIKDLPNKFKNLISRRGEIHDLLNVVTHQEVELKVEIEQLQKQAKLLEYSVGSVEFNKELSQLSKRLDDITSMRSFFKDKIIKLTHLLDLTGGMYK